MTQFVLVQAPLQPAPYGGVECALVTPRAESPAQAAVTLFSGDSPVWTALHLGRPIDKLVDASRSALFRGASFASTPFGGWLIQVSQAGAPMALFWASDYQDLPVADSPEHLVKIVTDQLLVESGNWELYAFLPGRSIPPGVGQRSAPPSHGPGA